MESRGSGKGTSQHVRYLSFFFFSSSRTFMLYIQIHRRLVEKIFLHDHSLTHSLIR